MTRAFFSGQSQHDILQEAEVGCSQTGYYKSTKISKNSPGPRSRKRRTWVPPRRNVEACRSTSRIIPDENIRQTREPGRVQERVQEPKRAQTRIDPRTIQQRDNSRKRRRTGRSTTDKGRRAVDEDAEEVALGGDVGVGTAGGVEEAGVGAFGEGGEIGRDDGVLVRGTGEVVGEATAGEEARDGGLRDVVGGADGGHADTIFF